MPNGLLGDKQPGMCFPYYLLGIGYGMCVGSYPKKWESCFQVKLI